MRSNQKWEKGCYIKNGKEAFAIPGFSVECVDTTGAGDSFCAGFLYGLSEKKDLYTLRDLRKRLRSAGCPAGGRLQGKDFMERCGKN